MKSGSPVILGIRMERLLDQAGSNWVIRLVCLAIATFLWGSVKMSKSYETTRSVALQFELPVGWQFSRPPPTATEVVVAGTGWSLLGSFVRNPEPQAVVTLPPRPTVTLQHSELAKSVRLGSGILVEPLGFGSLSLSLDTLTAKRVPVLADAHISVADDYITDTLRIFPDSVTVYGPWQVLDTLRFVSTIPHHALRMHQSQSYRLRLLNPEPDLLTLSEEEITLRLTIDQVTEKAFSVPVIPIGLSDSVRCFPQTVEVTCRVVTSYYDVLGPASFRVVADFSELSNYRVQRIVPLKAVGLPPWVDRVNIRPSAVEYLLME